MPANESVVPFINSLTVSTMLWWVLGLLAIVFTIHALTAAYHWYAFGSERFVSLLSAIIYISVGAILLIMMAITLLTI